MKRNISGGITGMAQGIFLTFIIGMIFWKYGQMAGGTYGHAARRAGELMVLVTGAGMGAGMAFGAQCTRIGVVCAAVAGMFGAYSQLIIFGRGSVKGALAISGQGDLLGAVLTAAVVTVICNIIEGKTKLDLLILPVVTLIVCIVTGIYLTPYISGFMSWLGAVIARAFSWQPLLMGMAVAVIFGMLCTTPLTALAFTTALGLSGEAAGAAAVGCCCQMVGFACMSFGDNGPVYSIVQFLGTPMIQFHNIIRRPAIWIPPIISSAILGPVSVAALHMVNDDVGAGVGTAGLLGQVMAWELMKPYTDRILLLIMIIGIHILMPALLCMFFKWLMMKKRWIHEGDMSLS